VEISAVVTTSNDEKRLEPALKSLEGVVSEIVVVDGLSADGTVDIARKFTPRVYEHPGASPVDQKSHAIELGSFPWVLCLDADERLSPELRTELLKLRRTEPECAGFSMPRRASYLGRWIRHSGWGPDRRVRLFRKGRASWEGEAWEERLTVDGPVEKLGGPIHYVPFGTIGDHAARVNKVSGLAAQRLYAQGKKAHLAGLVILPTLRCLRTYFLKLGCLDSFPGLVISVLDGYGAFLRSAKLRSIWKKGEHIEPFSY
jgi:glycosyltransferase involved in cell wall biosynthesis